MMKNTGYKYSLINFIFCVILLAFQVLFPAEPVMAQEPTLSLSIQTYNRDGSSGNGSLFFGSVNPATGPYIINNPYAVRLSIICNSSWNLKAGATGDFQAGQDRMPVSCLAYSFHGDNSFTPIGISPTSLLTGQGATTGREVLLDYRLQPSWTSPYGQYSTSLTYTVEAIDTTPPVISGVTGSVFTNASTKTIEATIKDNIGIKEAVLYYRPEGTGLFESLLMNNVSGDQWQASVPVNVAAIEYYIKAFDLSGNSTREPASSGYYRIVKDPAAPSFISHGLSGAVYITGSDYWIPAGGPVTVKLQGGDSGSGVRLTTLKAANPLDELVALHDWNNSSNHITVLDQSLFLAASSASETLESNGAYEVNFSLTGGLQDEDFDLYCQYEDFAANNTGFIDTGMNLRIDSSKPTGTIAINGGLAATNNTSANLTLSAADNRSGVAKMRFSGDGVSWTAWEDYNLTKAWTLPQGDGAKTVYVQYMDRVGNISLSFSDTIIYDTLPPTASITSPSNSSWVAGTVTITASVADSGSGVSKVQFYADGVLFATDTSSAGGWSGSWNSVPYADGTSAGLTIKAYDSAGNIVSSGTNTVIASLLQNPSMEIDGNADGKPDFWDDYSSYGSWGRTNGQKFYEKYSCSINDTSSVNAFGIGQDVISSGVAAGQVYTAAAWLYTPTSLSSNGGGTGAYLKMGFYNSSWGLLAQYETTPQLKFASWTKVTIPAKTAPPGTAHINILALVNQKTTGTVYVDGFHIVKGSATNY